MPPGLPSGFLTGDYRLFRLKDSRAQRFDYHFHDFDKVIFFLSGAVTYMVEGRAYFLRPGDALLVPHHHIHYPIIGSSTPYERVILWLSPAFLARDGLDACFLRAAEEGFHLLRREQRVRGEWLHLIQNMEASRVSPDFGHALLERTYCLQLLIALNRATLASRARPGESVWHIDPKIEAVLRFINGNLEGDLSVSALAGRFYLSESYLMHRFKAATGCTIHQYVLQKRLICAADLIRQGTPVMKAASSSGFQDYSSFLRAFQKAYHLAPKELRNRSDAVPEHHEPQRSPGGQVP